MRSRSSVRKQYGKKVQLEDLDADGIIMWTGSSGLSHVSLIFGDEFPVTQEAGNF
jgi:hypothetical protein